MAAGGTHRRRQPRDEANGRGQWMTKQGDDLGLACADRPFRTDSVSIISHNTRRDFGIKSGRGARLPAALAAVAAKKAEIVKAKSRNPMEGVIRNA